MKEVVKTAEAPAPIGPYSQAIMLSSSAEMLFVSGQIAIIPRIGEMDQRSIETETHQVMHNIRGVLSASGMGFGQVVKATIFILDMNDFPAINEAYGSYFNESFPARETVQVSALPKGARVEISVIACR